MCFGPSQCTLRHAKKGFHILPPVDCPRTHAYEQLNQYRAWRLVLAAALGLGAFLARLFDFRWKSVALHREGPLRPYKASWMREAS